MPKDAETETRTRRASTKDATAKRKKKDPNAPKRAMSSYMHFANAQRPVVLEENPGIAFGQVGKLLGERWKALTDAEKSPYEAQAAADKKRYEQEKAAYDQQQV